MSKSNSPSTPSRSLGAPAFPRATARNPAADLITRRKSLSPVGHGVDSTRVHDHSIRRRGEQLPTLLVRERSGHADAAKSPRQPPLALKPSFAPSSEPTSSSSSGAPQVRPLELGARDPVPPLRTPIDALPPRSPADAPTPFTPRPLPPVRADSFMSSSASHEESATIALLQQRVAESTEECTSLQTQVFDLERHVAMLQRQLQPPPPLEDSRMKKELEASHAREDELRAKVEKLQRQLDAEAARRQDTTQLLEQFNTERLQRHMLQRKHDETVENFQMKEERWQRSFQERESDMMHQIAIIKLERDQLKVMVDGFLAQGKLLSGEESSDSAILTSLSRENSEEAQSFDVSDMMAKAKAMQAEIATLHDDLRSCKQLLKKPPPVRLDGDFVCKRCTKQEWHPEGKVTLVFTDVENSTAMWEHNSKGMFACLAFHNRLMRQAIAEFRGYEVKTEGDAFMVAFQEAKDAVQFCLAVQKLLVSDFFFQAEDGIRDLMPDHSINGVLLFRGLRVRMGIHSGAPICLTDPTNGRIDYFGRSVNKAARISSVARAGQILISRDIVAEAKDDLNRLSSWCSLGLKSLKGFDYPEELFQVVPTTLALRTFAVNTDADADENFKFHSQLVSSQLEEVQREHESLKQRFAGIESRLAQLNADTCIFAAQLEALRNTELDRCASDDEQSALSRLRKDFEVLQQQHAESRVSFESMSKNTNELTSKISVLNAQVERLSAIENEQEKDLADATGQILSYGALSVKCKHLEASLAASETERLSILAQLASQDEEVRNLQEMNMSLRVSVEQCLKLKSKTRSLTEELEAATAKTRQLEAQLNELADQRLAWAASQSPTSASPAAPVAPPAPSSSLASSTASAPSSSVPAFSSSSSPQRFGTHSAPGSFTGFSQFGGVPRAPGSGHRSTPAKASDLEGVFIVRSLLQQDKAPEG
eukprot:TRINITY_DN160_c0_g2_i4.p1 TRINITY_DN160_c0_g2~~TRINITY_DN160_c0_g2_i4.p1  ORF type:complete len:938 (+),score=156.24 TRINITY_DN160_c0_g2_i4:142-2955(+)